MVAIQDPEENLDMEALANEVSKNLPTYARPLFVRTLQEVELTGNYKAINSSKL